MTIARMVSIVFSRMMAKISSDVMISRQLWTFALGKKMQEWGEEEERDESESFLLKMYWEEGMWFVAITKITSA